MDSLVEIEKAENKSTVVRAFTPHFFHDSYSDMSRQTFNTHDNSGGMTNNINGDFTMGDEIHVNHIASAQINIHFMSGSSSEVNQVLEHLFTPPSPRRRRHGAQRAQSHGLQPEERTERRERVARTTPSPDGAQLPGLLPTGQTRTTHVDDCYASATNSIVEFRLMIDIVHTMMANPILCSSTSLPETLAALQRILNLSERALQAYRHTPLSRTLSSAIAVGVEDFRQLLLDLLSNLTNYRYLIAAAVLWFIKTYLYGGLGQGAALDSKLREAHRSFAACLLALPGRQATLNRVLDLSLIMTACYRDVWPELERGMGEETLAELANFHFLLEQESASLQHIKVDAVIVIDHLGRNLPVPLIFCSSWQVRP